MVIVDTTVWVDYLNGVTNPQTDWLDREAGRQEIGLTELILCEVLQGIRSDKKFKEFKEQLLAFRVFSEVGMDGAVEAAENFRRLQKLGFPVRKTIDSLIATFCIREGFRLLHRDRDYDLFERNLGLSVVHP
jgi:predicted nucleic acid-binding protein